jgi:hypothetical protein
MIAEAVPCGPGLERHFQAIAAYRDSGFDKLYLRQIGQDQERLFDGYANEVLKGGARAARAT